MAVCADFVNGNFVQLATAIGDCNAYVAITSTEYASYLEAFTLDPVIVSAALLFGMTATVGSYITAYPVGVALGLIKKS